MIQSNLQRVCAKILQHGIDSFPLDVLGITYHKCLQDLNNNQISEVIYQQSFLLEHHLVNLLFRSFNVTGTESRMTLLLLFRIERSGCWLENLFKAWSLMVKERVY